MKINKQQLEETEKSITEIILTGSIVAFIVMIITAFINEYIIHSNILQTIGAISLGVAFISTVFGLPLSVIVTDTIETIIEKRERRSK